MGSERCIRDRAVRGLVPAAQRDVLGGGSMSYDVTPSLGTQRSECSSAHAMPSAPTADLRASETGSSILDEAERRLHDNGLDAFDLQNAGRLEATQVLVELKFTAVERQFILKVMRL